MVNNLETVLLTLKSVKIPINDILVDPNNPRLMKVSGDDVSDERITENDVQVQALKDTDDIGVRDISEKIKKVGFLTVDRVVVRPIGDSKYVVIEGNRRITAVKRLLESHKTGRETLKPKILQSMRIIEVLVYKGKDRNISWLLQGLRHINGVKNWGPLEQARFLVEMKERRKLSYTELSGMVGIGSGTAAIRVRAYRAWLQAREDDEYGDSLVPDSFSVFNDAVVRKPALRKWFGWDDKTSRFKNEENLKKFLSWYTSNEDDNGKIVAPRISRAIDVRDVLSIMVLDSNKEILHEFENGNITIDQARTKLTERETQRETSEQQVDLDARYNNLKELLQSIQTLPFTKILQDDEKRSLFENNLNEIINHAQSSLKILNTGSAIEYVPKKSRKSSKN